ncbi:hypothetical protein ABIE40_005656 [Rhizobium sp. OAE497]
MIYYRGTVRIWAETILLFGLAERCAKRMGLSNALSLPAHGICFECSRPPTHGEGRIMFHMNRETAGSADARRLRQPVQKHEKH